MELCVMRRFVRRGCGEGITNRNRRYTYSPWLQQVLLTPSVA